MVYSLPIREQARAPEYIYSIIKTIPQCLERGQYARWRGLGTGGAKEALVLGQLPGPFIRAVLHLSFPFQHQRGFPWFSSFPQQDLFPDNQQQLMQQKQVLQLIESVVRPLRQKIEHLEKENEMLKTQIGAHLRSPPEPPRRRSFSKEDRGTPKKVDIKEVLSPSSKKKEEKSEKPVWGHAKPVKPEQNQMKSPPPKDKNIQTPNSKVRALSKDKQSEKKVQSKQDKRIVGGKKADPHPQTSPKQPSKHHSPHPQSSSKQQQPL